MSRDDKRAFTFIPEGGKIPPQSIETEEAVLGAIMLEEDAAMNVIGILKPEMFYSTSHQHIYSAIYDMTNLGKAVDLITLMSELRKRGELEEIGGPVFLTELTSKVVSAANVESYAYIVKQKYTAREYLRLSQQIQTMVYSDEDINEITETAENELFKISCQSQTKEPKQISSCVDELLVRVQKIQKNPDQLIGVPSGLSDLDRITGGWQKSDLVIIAARPSVGKTSVLLTLIKGAALLNYPCAIFSLEMSEEQIVSRLMSGASGYSNMEIRNGKVDYQKLIGVSGQVADLPIFVDDTPGISIAELRSKTKKLILKNNIKMIGVDYIQLMNGDGASREQQVSAISRGLKGIAKEFNIPVIALSQLNREVESKGDHRPALSNLRESGCLTGDVEILCPSVGRLIPIKEIVNAKDFSIISTDMINIKEINAKKCFTTGIKKVYELTLLTGHKIKATANHKFLTKEGWCELRNLKNKKIAIPIDFESREIYSVPDEEVSLVAHFIANGCCLKSHALTYTCNVEDSDLAESVMRDAIVVTNNTVIPWYRDTMLSRGNFKTVYFKPTFHLTHHKRNPISDVMIKYNLFDVRGKDKFVPEKFYFLSNKQTRIFLRSLFTGDGCVCYREAGGRKILSLTYSSSSYKLITGVRLLLQKVGIISFVTRVENHKKQFWYHLEINGKRNIEKYVETIGFLSKRKQDKMIDGWGKYKTILAGWNKYDFNDEENLCFMPIKSIEYIGEEEVFDIEVPVEHNFTANGIIVHNSLEQDADLVAFISRPAMYNQESATIAGREYSTKNLMIFDLQKHRNGALYPVVLYHNDALTVISDNIEDVNKLPF